MQMKFTSILSHSYIFFNVTQLLKMSGLNELNVVVDLV